MHFSVAPALHAAAARLASRGVTPAPLDASPEAIALRLATPMALSLATALAAVDDDGVKVCLNHPTTRNAFLFVCLQVYSVSRQLYSSTLSTFSHITALCMLAWQVAVGDILAALGSSNPSRRRVSAWVAGRFTTLTGADTSSQLKSILQALIGRLVEPDEHALSEGLAALATVTSAAAIDELAAHLDFVRSCLAALLSDAQV